METFLYAILVLLVGAWLIRKFVGCMARFVIIFILVCILAFLTWLNQPA